MPLRETLKEAGYTYEYKLHKGSHVLRNNDTHLLEVWHCNKNHASYGLKYKNTHLEFAYSGAKELAT